MDMYSYPPSNKRWSSYGQLSAAIQLFDIPNFQGICYPQSKSSQYDVSLFLDCYDSWFCLVSCITWPFFLMVLPSSLWWYFPWKSALSLHPKDVCMFQENIIVELIFPWRWCKPQLNLCGIKFIFLHMNIFAVALYILDSGFWAISMDGLIHKQILLELSFFPPPTEKCTPWEWISCNL